MTVTPVPHEPTRYWVSSETDPAGPPYMVDLDDDGTATCSCSIIHNRTAANAHCKHIAPAREAHTKRQILGKLQTKIVPTGDFQHDPNPL